MAARSRPRGGQLKDEFDEERSLWNQIRADARRIDQLMVSSLHTFLPSRVSSYSFLLCRLQQIWSPQESWPKSSETCKARLDGRRPSRSEVRAGRIHCQSRVRCERWTMKRLSRLERLERRRCGVPADQVQRQSRSQSQSQSHIRCKRQRMKRRKTYGAISRRLEKILIE
jgi:hypothetical protein